ncbi:MAG: c-type cytochrome [Petrimonas sp.]|nr:c-type cytochrome [Petrimonas sp.]
MKKIILLVVLGWSTLMLGNVDNGVGASIFNNRGCTMCHALDMDMVGPSIRTISIRYSGNENALVMYLKGQGQPIVYPERGEMMRPQLMKIANLYEDEYRSLARYIIQAFMRVDF